MADLTTLSVSFNKGMNQDAPRDRLNNGYAWNMVDYLFDLDAPLEKRGGWAYLNSSALSAGSYTIAGAFAPFAAAGKHCVINNTPTLWTISGGTGTAIGAALAPKAKLSFHRDKLIITGTGAAAPKYYDGTTLGDLAGAPPNAAYSAVYKDRTYLAGSTALPNRVHASGAGDPTSWDTTNAWIDFSFPVTGIAALRDALIVFSDGRIERLTGTSPPPGSDFSKKTLWEPGCCDARSIEIFDDMAIFAHTTGIYMTDGATVEDLTEVVGAKDYWRNLMASWTSSFYVTAGRIRNYYIITVLNASRTFQDCLMIDVANQRWTRVANLPAAMFWQSIGTSPDTYAALADSLRVASLSTMFTPSATYKADADGDSVVPVLETPFYNLADGLGIVRDVHTMYDIRDAASDNPTLTLSYLTSPEATSYTAVTDHAAAAYVLPETTAMTVARRKLNKRAYGMGLKLAQSNASASTRVFGMKMHGRPLEGSRLQ